MRPVDKTESDEGIVNRPRLPIIETPKPIKTCNDLFEDTRTPALPGVPTNDETKPLLEGTLALHENSVTPDLQDLAQNIKSMMEFSENMTSKNGRARICKVCGKEGAYRTITDHIEAHHITGITHTCNICEKNFRSRNAMRAHNFRDHKQ